MCGFRYELSPFEGFFDRSGWTDLIKIFSAPFWSKYADEYGGTKWAHICKCTMQLLDAIKNGSPLDIIHTLDKVMDLHHNNGSLLTPSKVGKMAIDQHVLDIRARLRSVEDFLPYVSTQVKNLIIGSKNYLEESVLNEALIDSQKSLI
jgi:hypothetical protein